VAGGSASRVATPGTEVDVLLCSVGSRGRTGSGGKGGEREREGCREYDGWEGLGEAATGAGSLGLVDPDRARQEVCGKEWIQMLGEWAGSEGGCGMVCCNNLQNCLEGEWSGECSGRLKCCRSCQVTQMGSFGQGRISGAEGDRGVAGPTGVLWGQGVLGRSGGAVVGIWEVGVGGVGSISFTVNDGKSMGRSGGRAEARGEWLLGKGWFWSTRA